MRCKMESIYPVLTWIFGIGFVGGMFFAWFFYTWMRELEISWENRGFRDREEKRKHPDRDPDPPVEPAAARAYFKGYNENEQGVDMYA